MVMIFRQVVRGALGATLCFILLSYGTWAAEETPEEKSLEWSGSVGMFSNYLTRGLSQSWGKPVFQAEIGAEHETGLFFGAFTSSLSQNLYPGGRMELNVWAGYEYPLSEEITVSLEAVYYAFPGANISKATCGVAIPCPSRPHRFNTAQLRVGTTWHGVTLRMDFYLTDYFAESSQTGFAGSTRGTLYYELNTEHALPRRSDWKVLAHLGFTRFPVKYADTDTGVSRNPNYWDWYAGVAKEFEGSLKGWRTSLLVGGAFRRAFDVSPSLINERTRNLGKPALVLGIERLF